MNLTTSGAGALGVRLLSFLAGLAISLILVGCGGGQVAGSSIDTVGNAKYQVDFREYDFGAESAPILNFKKKGEMRAAVYFPKNAPGPRPVIVISHASYDPCGTGFKSEIWPCAGPTLQGFRGYDAIGRSLASHGYVVVSTSSNAINVYYDLIDDGLLARGDLILQHLALLKEASLGKVGALKFLEGRIDLGNVGLIGHSQGGDAMMNAATLNIERNSGYGIRGLFGLAPTSGTRTTVPNTPMAILLPYCDGDIFGLDGQAFVEDGGHAFHDSALRTSLLVMGANHNFFNSQLSDDDGRGFYDSLCRSEGVGRLSRSDQEYVGASYVTGFFRLVFDDEVNFLSLFDGSEVRLAAQPTADVRSSPILPREARTDFLVAAEQLGDWKVSGDARAGWCAMFTDRLPACISAQQYDRGFDRFPQWRRNLAGPMGSGPVLHARWQGAGAVAIDMAGGREDSLQYDRLIVRLISGPPLNDLVMSVVDRSGRRVSFRLAELVPRLPDIELGEAKLASTWLPQSVAIPLTSLNTLDRAHLARIEFSATTLGDLYISDISFARAAVRAVGSDVPVPLAHVRSTPYVRGMKDQRITLTATLSQPARYPVAMGLLISDLGVIASGIEIPVGATEASTVVTIPNGSSNVSITAGNGRNVVVVGAMTKASVREQP